MILGLPKTLRVSLAVLATLSLAVISHIAVVLAIPHQVVHSAYKQVGNFGPDRQFNLLPDVKAGAEPLPGLDPAMKHAACRYQLADGPVLFTAAVPVPFWSIGLFNEAGEVVYSLNNRTAGSDILSMLLITPQQLSILRENPPQDLDKLIVIETETDRGFALLRAFSPSTDRDLEVNLAMKTAYCGQYR